MILQRILCLFVLWIQQCLVNCHAPNSLIWSRKLQNFVPISNDSTFEADRNKMIVRSRKEEIHNFQKKVLRLGYIQDDNLVDFYDNNTKITGVYGEIWNMLAEHSNFTLVIIRAQKLLPFPRNQWRVSIYGMWLTRRIDIVPEVPFLKGVYDVANPTTPIWQTRNKLYILPEWKSDINWIFNMISNEVLGAILLFLLIFSAVGYFKHNILIREFGDDERRHSFLDHLFYIFGTICAQGFIPESLDQRTKVFGILKKIFAWILLILCSSYLISYMTNRTVRQPFYDVDSLLNNTSYKLMMYNGSMVAVFYLDYRAYLWNNGQLNSAKRFLVAMTQDELYEAGCNRDEKIAIFDNEDLNQGRRSRFCELVPMGRAFFRNWVTFGLQKYLKNKRSFDIGIIKMREFGLINALKNRWIKSNAASLDAPFTPIEFDQVAMFFVILSIGMVTAVTIFVLEIIVFFQQHHH